MMADKYDNQFEIDELQKAVYNIDPKLRLGEFRLRGNRVIGVIVRILEKGNKKTIDALVSMGFYKVRRQKVMSSDYWSMSTTYPMEVILEKPLVVRRCSDG